MIRRGSDECSALSLYPEEKTVASRSVVPANQVIRIVHKFNQANLVNEKEVNCKTIVDGFAGGSGILQQVQLRLSDCLKSVDLKKFEFISVDHPKIPKAIKLDQRVDVYASQCAVPAANYICQPPITGGELVACMYFAESCRDFCDFLLPATWINSTEVLQRAWWGRKCMEKKAYMLTVSAGHQWMVIVNSQRKGQKLFANSTNVELAGSEKEVRLYAQCVKNAKASGGDA
ncbi:hypothetical protein CYMTET_25298 [Cymbomonas tetramitiformis]|uniref:Uncharacterized protein n=1 Tax=Cymbomonas tetramitiformis TaxID=36881 RepID=A0AAE0FUU3_9CHLO|nr:hypothetical protein CYMTET_25298 [Cymbomonas tetramitiformis]